MPRSKKVKSIKTKADPLYQNLLLTKLINKSMKDGKKTIARKQVYLAFEQIKNKFKKDPIEIFYQALENARPRMEVRSRRVGGATYQVPYPVSGGRRDSLAIKWLIAAARSRPNREYHSFAEKLAVELIESAQGQGLAVEKKANIHRMAEANKAFAHFRW
ncbi:30S ribosomal protein S7 [Patescibacteria group bacterium]|nr:30S ribosomal protein S7 [Patescibacteria group bacterium]MBU1931274.1 30S ribosomal protein S7 [Patescibacteria group bacterium]